MLSNFDTHVDNFAEFETSFEGKMRNWGWSVPVRTEPTPPGLIMDDKLVLRTHLWLMKVQACFPRACTALCTVEWALFVWKGVIRSGPMASGAAIGPPGGAQLYLVRLQTQVHLSPPKETVTGQTDAL